MKKKFQLLVALLLICGYSVSAQTGNSLAIEKQYPDDDRAKALYDKAYEINYDSKGKAVRTTWLANKPGSNWFVSLGAGAGILMSEETRFMKFSDQITPTFQLAFGKWFSPVWGLRVNVTSSRLNGFVSLYGPDDTMQGAWYVGHKYTNELGETGTNTYRPAYWEEGKDNETYQKWLRNRFTDGKIYTAPNGPEGEVDGYRYDILYAAGTVDFMLNLKNLFMPYNNKAFFNPVLYAGLGYAHTFREKGLDWENELDYRSEVHSFMQKAGLMFNFRLADPVELFLDAQLLVLPEFFDRRLGDNMTHDAVGNLTLGLTYRFNFRHFIKAPLYDQREIDGLLREIDDLRNRPEIECPPVVICPEVVEVVEPDPFYLTPVFFTLDSYVVRDNQWISIAKAAEYLMQNPKTRIQIAGYADKNTGNPSYNMKLSEKRAKAVANVLVDKFGIEKSRLEITFFGDKVQPFAENDWNRVALFILPE
ncbi:OmpA family protein [Bacteroidales bacterium OttesenSCG-928-I14]|nr:OmpA family protein [Bacteroidales bacterium OttesenSCG-928-I14]